ncbi:hypothetical protein PUN28_017217 [Cardiocondyla obscurior]|uniref:Uncharacterized protein n=1 Tax=Cardiocondyla obscurior TaxID=286306 RepID=A0AAW2EKT6_9HYME
MKNRLMINLIDYPFRRYGCSTGPAAPESLNILAHLRNSLTLRRLRSPSGILKHCTHKRSAFSRSPTCGHYQHRLHGSSTGHVGVPLIRIINEGA